MGKYKIYFFFAAVLIVMVLVFKNTETEVDEAAELPPVLDKTVTTAVDKPIKVEEYPDIFTPRTKETPAGPIAGDEVVQKSRELISGTTRKIKELLAQDAVRIYGAVTGLKIAPPFEFRDFEISDFETDTTVFETVANSRQQIFLLSRSPKSSGDDIAKKIALSRNLDLKNAFELGKTGPLRFVQFNVEGRSILLMSATDKAGTGFVAAWTQPSAHSKNEIELFKRSIQIGTPSQ